MRPSMQPPFSVSYCPHNKPLFANLSCNSTAQLLTKPSSGMSLQEDANFPPTVYTTLLLLLLRLACNRRHYSSHSRYTWILLRALTFSTDSDSMKNLLAIAVVTFFWVPRHETPLQGILQIIFHRTTKHTVPWKPAWK